MNYNSKQRNIILKTINKLYHPTAEELYKEVNRLYPTISRSTVYRNIGILLKNNDIKKVKVLTGPDRFDGNSREHYHLICEKCGHVFDFIYHFDGENLKNSIMEQIGVITDINSITLYGICNECKFQKKED